MSRALIRAQLIEEGCDVLATDSWSVLRRSLRPGAKPAVVLVDLKGLPDPAGILRDLRLLMKPSRVLVITASGTIDAADVRSLEFPMISRPVSIEAIVRAVTRAIRSAHG